MAYTYRIYTQHRFSVVSLTGPVTGEELLRAIADHFADEAWEPGFDTLWNFSGITEFLLEPSDLRAFGELTGRLESRLGEGKAATVAARDIDYEVSQTLLLYKRSPRERKLFRSVAEATAWLGIPGDLDFLG